MTGSTDISTADKMSPPCWWPLSLGVAVMALTFGIAGIVMYLREVHQLSTMVATTCTTTSNGIYDSSCSYCQWIQVNNDTQCWRIYYTCFCGQWTISYQYQNHSYTETTNQKSCDNQNTAGQAQAWLASNHPLGQQVRCWTNGEEVLYSVPNHTTGIVLLCFGFVPPGLLLLAAMAYVIYRYFQNCAWQDCSILHTTKYPPLLVRRPCTPPEISKKAASYGAVPDLYDDIDRLPTYSQSQLPLV